MNKLEYSNHDAEVREANRVLPQAADSLDSAVSQLTLSVATSPIVQSFPELIQRSICFQLTPDSANLSLVSIVSARAGVLAV